MFLFTALCYASSVLPVVQSSLDHILFAKMKNYIQLLINHVSVTVVYCIEIAEDIVKIV